MAKSDVVHNPMVMGNSNNTKNQGFFSDVLINNYLGFPSELVKQTYLNNNTNDSEDLLSDQYKEADVKPKEKLRRKESKRKKSPWII